jgi:DnaJ-class molecular chaperone
MSSISDEASQRAIRAWIQQQHSELDRASYYHLLGVARDAHEPAIRSAYYALVARLHPDLYVNTLDSATRGLLVTIYSRIVEAYRVLADGKKREQYDRALAQGRLRWSPEEEKVAQARRDPDAEIGNPHAKKFFKLGRAALVAGDGKAAVMNLKLALSVEPKSEIIRTELARAEALLKSQGG